MTAQDAAWKKCPFLELEGLAGNFCWHPNRVDQCLEDKCPMPPVNVEITIENVAGDE